MSLARAIGRIIIAITRLNMAPRVPFVCSSKRFAGAR